MHNIFENKDYAEGFISKCAEMRVDPNELIKFAARGAGIAKLLTEGESLVGASKKVGTEFNALQKLINTVLSSSKKIPVNRFAPAADRLNFAKSIPINRGGGGYGSSYGIAKDQMVDMDMFLDAIRNLRRKIPDQKLILKIDGLRKQLPVSGADVLKNLLG